MSFPSRVRILAALGLLGASFAQDLGSQSNWLSNWSFRRAVSNLSPIGLAAGDRLTNFPVLIRLSNDLVVKSAFQSEGGDLTFAGPDGVQLFHEIEAIDKANGHLAAWVCLPFFSNRSLLYVYSSNTNASLSFVGSNNDEGLTGTFANFRTAAAIWQRTWESNYYAVFHFTNATGARPTDSTRWTNHVTGQVGSVHTGGSNGIAGPGWYSELNAAVTGAYLTVAAATIARDPNYVTNRSATQSMWYRPLDNPSNLRPNAPDTSTSNNQSVLFAWLGNSTLGNDSKGYLYWGSANANPAYARVLDRGANATTGTFVEGGWLYESVGGGIDFGVKQATRWVQNAQTLALDGSTAMQSGTVVGDLRLMGAANSAPPSYRFNAVGWFDEYRLSTTLRSSNWSLTEYSNTLSATNGGAYILGNVETFEKVYAFPVTNLGSYEFSVGTTSTLGVAASTLQIPFTFWGNFISNVTWIVSNPYDGSTAPAVSSNYTAGQRPFAFTHTFTNGGTMWVIARCKDLTNLDPEFKTSVKVYSNFIGNLVNLKVTNLDSGIGLDLFGAVPAGVTAAPYTLAVTRNGRPVSPSLLRDSTWVDRDALFYGVPYSYAVSLAYAGGPVFSGSGSSTGVEPGAITNTASGSVKATGVRSFEWTLTVPPASPSRSERVVVLAKPSPEVQSRERKDVIAVRQRTFLDLEGGDADPWGDGNALVTVRVALSNGRAWFPEIATPFLPADDLRRFTIGVWDGRDWMSRPTTLQVAVDSFSLTAPVATEGRYAVLVNGSPSFSNAGGDLAIVTGRLLRLDAPGDRLSISVPNEAFDAVRLSVLDLSGRTVYQEIAKGLQNMVWDGRSASGGRVGPGLYLWAVRVGQADTTIYRGTVLVAP